MKTYHEILKSTVVALAGWGLAAWAAAGQLDVAAMRLSYDDAGWRRGDAREEAEMASYVLVSTRPELSLQLYVPHPAVPMKADDAQFREQLARKWQSLYGKEASIGGQSLGGRDWSTCRRPSRDGKSTVFQWVTTEAGQAYTLIWFGDGEIAELPGPASELLAGISFPPAGTEAAAALPAPPTNTPTPPVVASRVVESKPNLLPPEPLPSGPVPMATQPGPDSAVPDPIPAPAPETPPQTAAGGQAEEQAKQQAQAVSEPGHASAEAVQPPPALPPGTTWRLVRTVVSKPALGVLDFLAHEDAKRLSKGSQLTGYGMSSGEHELDWFLEGFRWVPRESGPGEKKARYRLGWRVDWGAPPEALDGREFQPMTVMFEPAGSEGLVPTPFTLRFDWLQLCAGDRARRTLYWNLSKGRHAPLKKMTWSQGCPEPEAQPLPPFQVVAVDGAGLAAGKPERLISLALPRPVDLPLAAPGMQRVLVLAVRFAVSEAEDQPGDGLLRQAGVYYLYTPDAEEPQAAP